jgi:protease YdgD
MAMFGTLARRVLLLAALVIAWPLAAAGDAIHLGSHRDDVDSSRHPWSAIGKLYNETGGACSGVVIARDKVLTAAHCVYNFRTQQFIPAPALHFLVGYRTGKYAAHARVLIYQIGTNFDPQRYTETSDGDWAVLTLSERLPEDVVPLKLRADIAPSGTKAVMAGYPQDRAHALTADGDCELREKIVGGRLLLHTCRGIGGYSGAPILIRTGGNEMQIAGIQIAKLNSGGAPQMLAVPAQAIARASFTAIEVHPAPDPPAVKALRVVAAASGCDAPERMEHVLLVAAQAARTDDDPPREPLPAAISPI